MMVEHLAILFAGVPLFPFFEVVHYVSSSMSVRNDEGARQFAYKHPLSSCIACLLTCFGGTITSNLLLGLPVGAPLMHPLRIGLASLVWYLMFFSPGDFLFKFSSHLPVKVVIVILKDWRRARQALAGVLISLNHYPNAWLLAIVVGTLKASGTKWMMTAERLLRGSAKASKHELINMAFVTKGAFISSAFFVVHHHDLLAVSQHILLFTLAVGLMSVSVTILLIGIRDPLCVVADACSSVFIGSDSMMTDSCKAGAEHSFKEHPKKD